MKNLTLDTLVSDKGIRGLVIVLTALKTAPAIVEEIPIQKNNKKIDITQQEFKKKVGSFLQRRGFNYETVNHTLETLIDELSEKEPEFFMDISRWD